MKVQNRTTSAPDPTKTHSRLSSISAPETATEMSYNATERLRARLDEYRLRVSAGAGRRVTLESVVEWTRSVGDGLDGEERRDLLDLLLRDATIDRENRVTLTLVIPADGELVPIAKPEPSFRSSSPHQTLRYSWAVSLPSPSAAARRTRRDGASLVPEGAARSTSSTLSS